MAIIWDEAVKGFLSYVKTNWVATPIVWPRQEYKPTGTSWVQLHVIRLEELVARRVDKASGTLLVQFTVFSTEENQYEVPTLLTTFATLFLRKQIETTHYILSLTEYSVASAFQDTVEKHLWVNPITITVRIQEK
jgi:hypothetical protein